MAHIDQDLATQTNIKGASRGDESPVNLSGYRRDIPSHEQKEKNTDSANVVVDYRVEVETASGKGMSIPKLLQAT